METLTNNTPIDPLIRTTYFNQRDLSASESPDVDADTASVAAGVKPENWMALGFDEETAKKAAEGSLLPTREPITKLSDIFSAQRQDRLHKLEKRAINGADKPAIAKDYKPLGKPQVKHITREQHRIELGLNGNSTKLNNQELQVA